MHEQRFEHASSHTNIWRHVSISRANVIYLDISRANLIYLDHTIIFYNGLCVTTPSVISNKISYGGNGNMI